jgi:GGDEF domain-containing protein
VIIRNEDYQNREALAEQFEQSRKEICEKAENSWEKVCVAMGIADYDPEQDYSVNDTVRRADRLMYENKRQRKVHRS